MKLTIVLVLLLSLSWATVIPRVTPIHSHVPLTYKIDLDLSPKQRYRQAYEDFKKPIQKFMNLFDMLPIPQSFMKEVEYLAKNEYSQHEFVAEIQGIADVSGYPFAKIFMINMMYEYSTFKACTGILVRNSQGKVMHGRNLDFEMWGLLSNLLIKAQFYKGGKKLFTSDTIIGSVFVLTGIKQNGFAANVDTRTEKNIYEDLIPMIKNNAMPTCWLLRKVLEEETTYAGAINRLKNDNISAPVYYVVSGVGPNQGSIIEREPYHTHAHYELNETTWFLVQTNYDRDYPDPIHDPRRIPVEKKMRERGNQNFTPQTLLDHFMSQWPTLNIATIMSAIMVPAEGYHNVTAWYGQNPKITANMLQTE